MTLTAEVSSKWCKNSSGQWVPLIGQPRALETQDDANDDEYAENARWVVGLSADRRQQLVNRVGHLFPPPVYELAPEDQATNLELKVRVANTGSSRKRPRKTGVALRIDIAEVAALLAKAVHRRRQLIALQVRLELYYRRQLMPEQFAEWQQRTRAELVRDLARSDATIAKRRVRLKRLTKRAVREEDEYG